MQPPSTSVLLLARLGSIDDPEAWSRFVVLYGPHVIRWCRNYGLQEADAQDVAQDVLLRLSKQLSRFQYDPSKSFRGWLRTVVHSAWISWVKRQRPWEQGSGMSEALRPLQEIPARDDLLARIEAQYDRELFEIAVARVRDRVEPRTWEMFRLLAFDGEKGEEVADRLGLAPNTPFAARNKVQRLIREEVEKLDPSS
jgi:RNA polymerase sigma-70 factor (ECF subfamily)